MNKLKELLNEIERVWDISYDNGTTFFIKKDKSYTCNNWENFKEKLLNDAISESRGKMFASSEQDDNGSKQEGVKDE